MRAQVLVSLPSDPSLGLDFSANLNSLDQQFVGHARVAKWQTRWLQVPVSARTCGFKSRLAHVRGIPINAQTLIISLEIIGVIGFALSGIIEAARKQFDLVGVVKNKVAQKSDAIQAAREALGNVSDPQEHNRIYTNLQKTLTGIDTGNATASPLPQGASGATEYDWVNGQLVPRRQ